MLKSELVVDKIQWHAFVYTVMNVGFRGYAEYLEKHYRLGCCALQLNPTENSSSN
jgi:hypothetical protein